MMLAALLPEYMCHKSVRGARIVEVVLDNVDEPEWGTITLEVPHKPLIQVRTTAHWIDFNRVEIGMYYVRYEGGHEACVPAAEFENDYSRVVTGGDAWIDQIAPLAGRVWNKPLESAMLPADRKLVEVLARVAMPQARVMVDTLGHSPGCPRRWNEQATCTCGERKRA